VRDTAGNFYGTTAQGGAWNQGTVYQVNQSGETVLYSFTGGLDGGQPGGGVILDSSGNLYGTTLVGGASNCGVVFELDASGTETVLYSFAGGTDGCQPFASVIRDSAGNLYGTTGGGGAGNHGTVFKLAPGGAETVIYSFTEGTDGGLPEAGVIRDSAGNLYGTTNQGGDLSIDGLGCGVVFKVDPSGTETVLHTFNSSDGGFPVASLTADSAGNLYGTTFFGGPSNLGVVFMLAPSGTYTILHGFSGSPDGSEPEAALIRDSAGNLYGTTSSGGVSGWGTVFKIDTTGAFTLFYSFMGHIGGANPLAGLTADGFGNLWGTTDNAGFHFTYGYGVVYRLTP